MVNRWWVYQRERFPLVAHGLLILAFSFSAVAVSSMLRGRFSVPPWPSLLVAFVTCFLFFLQLRIADEFKDFDEDARYRPYRPVPRGLVSLRELGAVFVLACVVQAGLAWWLDPDLILLLLITWAYLAFMSKEFFVRDFLKNRPVLYMVSHMFIMPLIDLYATGTDWLVAGAGPPRGLLWFLLASFFNGMVIEIGRKVRRPEDEEEGVATYSVVWGRACAVAAWLGVMLATAGFALLAAMHIGVPFQIAIILGGALAAAAVLGLWFLRAPAPGRGRWIEHMSGLWTLILYTALGVLPLVWRATVG